MNECKKIKIDRTKKKKNPKLSQNNSKDFDTGEYERNHLDPIRKCQIREVLYNKKYSVHRRAAAFAAKF